MLGGHDGSYIHVIWLVASAFGVAALVALSIVYRRAAQRADLEHAERVIAEDEDHSSSSS